MSGSPPKPWERSGGEGASGPAPFKPPSGGSTSDVVEASGIAKPGENVTATKRNVATNVDDTVSRSMPQWPWQQTGYGNTYGDTVVLVCTVHMVDTAILMVDMYSGYGGGYGGGGLYGGSGMYGGMGGYGDYSMGGMGGMGGMGMGPSGIQDSNPPSCITAKFLGVLPRVMHGVINFFGRISFLVEHAQASYFFMTAMLQLFDWSAMLYGELARFVLHLLGIRRKPKKGSIQGPEAPTFEGPGQQFFEAPKGNNLDNVWGN